MGLFGYAALLSEEAASAVVVRKIAKTRQSAAVAVDLIM
jgi:hypothetical protein